MSALTAPAGKSSLAKCWRTSWPGSPPASAIHLLPKPEHRPGQISPVEGKASTTAGGCPTIRPHGLLPRCGTHPRRRAEHRQGAFCSSVKRRLGLCAPPLPADLRARDSSNRRPALGARAEALPCQRFTLQTSQPAGAWIVGALPGGREGDIHAKAWLVRVDHPPVNRPGWLSRVSSSKSLTSNEMISMAIASARRRTSRQEVP